MANKKKEKEEAWKLSQKIYFIRPRRWWGRRELFKHIFNSRQAPSPQSLWPEHTFHDNSSFKFPANWWEWGEKSNKNSALNLMRERKVEIARESLTRKRNQLNFFTTSNLSSNSGVAQRRRWRMLTFKCLSAAFAYTHVRFNGEEEASLNKLHVKI